MLTFCTRTVSGVSLDAADARFQSMAAGIAGRRSVGGIGSSVCWSSASFYSPV